MNALVAAGAGFLLAVLWFDLMFDAQALRSRERILPEEILDSMASYYRRVTTGARAMSRLVAAFMLLTLAGIVAEIARGEIPAWTAWASLALAAAAILTAAMRTFPSAVRLGSRGDPVDRQTALARSIGREHVVCLAAIAALLVLQIATA